MVGVCVPPIALGHPVLDLPVGGQGPHHQVHVELGSVEPPVEPLPVGVTVHHLPEAVGLRIVALQKCGKSDKP